MEKVMKYLNVETPSMSVEEVENWLNEIWILEKPLFGIPIEQGLSCTLCNYCSRNSNTIKSHFSKSHKGSKRSDLTRQCQVQRPFKGQFHKFIQVEDENELDLKSDQEENWKMTLKEDFKRKVRRNENIKDSETMDLRLIGAFISKIR